MINLYPGWIESIRKGPRLEKLSDWYIAFTCLYFRPKLSQVHFFTYFWSGLGREACDQDGLQFCYWLKVLNLSVLCATIFLVLFKHFDPVLRTVIIILQTALNIPFSPPSPIRIGLWKNRGSVSSVLVRSRKILWGRIRRGSVKKSGWRKYCPAGL